MKIIVGTFFNNLGDPNLPLDQNPLRNEATGKMERQALKRLERDAELWHDPSYRQIRSMKYQPLGE